MEFSRAAGILLPVFSLPAPYGIGDIGQCAYDFIDFLASAGQSFWQVLPVGPTSYGDSPYQSYSSFAGNPYFIALDALCAQGLLTEDELKQAQCPVAPIDYGALYTTRFPLLRRAYERACAAGWRRDAFLSQERDWLEGYALYMACKDEFEGKCFIDWPEDIRRHEPEAVARYTEQLHEAIGFYVFLQETFYAQWDALRAHAVKRGVRIIGDIPIYVPLDAADLWESPENFQMDGRGLPTAVAGVPPDYFNEDGQLWGNPLYDWERMAENGFAWWLRRIAGAQRLFDVLRIDHFRGLASYWRVPWGAPNARGGEWVQGPGMAFIEALRARFPQLPIIAEDLGDISEDVRTLLKASGYPGMKVLQFAFDAHTPSDYLPHNYDAHCVCYTGTHDNTTLRAWFSEISAADAAFATQYLGLNRREGAVQGMLRGGMGSTAMLFMACMQDYLESGAEARINTPGCMGNWRWRMQAGDASEALAQSIAAMSKRYGR